MYLYAVKTWCTACSSYNTSEFILQSITNPTRGGVLKFKRIYVMTCCASNPISQYSTYELILKKPRLFCRAIIIIVKYIFLNVLIVNTRDGLIQRVSINAFQNLIEFILTRTFLYKYGY